MKRRIAVCLILTVIICFCACGKKADPIPANTIAPEAPAPNTAPTPEATLAPPSDAPDIVLEVVPEQETVAAAETEEPTPDVVAGPPVIVTKNPTSESLTIGGRTWFIAHAENAWSLTWQLIDPYGEVYSLESAMAVNPGLQLEALEGDTIAVSNVPITLNGWGVQARFDGDGNFAVTEPAYIYVRDFESAYSSIINRYLRTRSSDVANIGQYAYENDISEFCVNAESVGYALKDLDKNGIPELIISSIGYNPENNAHVR